MRLPSSLTNASLSFVQACVDRVHDRLSPWALACAALGLAMLLAGLLWPRSGRWARRLTLEQAGSAIMFVMATSLVLWAIYLHVGKRTYDLALQADRRGQPVQACTHYRQIERNYPFQVDPFVRRARKGRRECQLYIDAESAYRSADYEMAARRYEAFLLNSPAIALRQEAQSRLLDALLKWGGELAEAGERERALDRYRFVRDSALDRSGPDVRIQPIITDLYLDWGDELLLNGDPQAALATYRRIMHDVADPSLWDRGEGRMVDAYCAWVTQLREQDQPERAAGVCVELSLELPSAVPDCCPKANP